MAHRGRDTLRFGPMKPVGLVDPRTGREPYAAVQLRQDNLAGDHFSLVGFQTQIKWGEQARVLRLIPGLEQAEFVRFGMVHRNTYVNGPTVLAETWQVRTRPRSVLRRPDVRRRRLRRIGGVGPARRAQRRGAGDRRSRRRAPPRTTAIGALAYYVSHADPAHYEPSNITFGIMPPLDVRPGSGAPRSADRKLAMSERALQDLDGWSRSHSDMWIGEDLREMTMLDDQALKTLVADFLEFLRFNRNASAHTVRAYAGDLTQFIDYVAASQKTRASDADAGAT